MLRPQDLTQRALLSSIGSLGNGGVVAIFAVLYYPYLPLIGKSIKVVCFIGTVLVALGYGTASLSHYVNLRQSSIARALTDFDAGLDPSRLSGSARWRWNRPFDQHPRAHSSRVFLNSKWFGARDHVCL